MSRYLVDLRIALFQLNPQIGQLEQNIERSWKLITNFKQKLETHKNVKFPQIVVFPELALTGYSFHSQNEIKPYISLTEKSPTFQFAQRVSKLFNCYTVIGYPEEGPDLKWYNSALVTDPMGKLTFNYRKSFLYDTEYEWDCQENPKGFQKFPLTFQKNAVKVNDKDQSPQDITLNSSIGICMDLNPYKFQAPFNEFEFASFNLNNNIDLMICPMAWLHSKSVTNHDHDEDIINEKLNSLKHDLKSQSLPSYGSQNDFQFDLNNSNVSMRIPKDDDSIDTDYTEMDKPDMSNVNYWMLRFLPFLNLSVRKSWYKQLYNDRHDEDIFDDQNKTYIGMSRDKCWEFEGKNSLLLLNNRCGIEDDKTVFAGSSGIFKLNGKTTRSDNDYETNIDSMNESVELLGNLGKGLEGVIMRDVQFEVEK